MWTSVMRAAGAGYAALVVTFGGLEFGSWVVPILVEPFIWEVVPAFALVFVGGVLVMVDRVRRDRPGPSPLIGAPEPPKPPLSRRPIARKPDGVRCVSHAWWVQFGLGDRRGALGFFSVIACVVACCLRPLQPPTAAAEAPDLAAPSARSLRNSAR